MGFRKPLYDVEEKGLNPSVPYRNKDLGSDGRLLPEQDRLDTPAAVAPLTEEPNQSKPAKVKAAPKAKKKAATTPRSVGKTATKKTVDKPQDALKELPVDQSSKTVTKKSPPKKRTTKTKAKKKTTRKKRSSTSKRERVTKT